MFYNFTNIGHKNIIASINSEEGHFGSTDNSENLDKLTWEYAWLDSMMFEKDTQI
jgi:protease II